MKRFFITSSGTGIGKTMLTTALIRGLRAQGKTIIAQKPVISGWDEADNDSYAILDALGLERNQGNLDAITRYRFDAPISPDIAARNENNPIDFEVLRLFCTPQESADIHIIEGAGGVMVPLNKNHLTIDLISAIQASAILVVGSYLGSISHTLTALSVLNSRNVKISGVVISASEQSAVLLGEMATTFKNFTAAPIFLIHRLPKDASLELRIPEILRMVE